MVSQDRANSTVFFLAELHLGIIWCVLDHTLGLLCNDESSHDEYESSGISVFPPCIINR